MSQAALSATRFLHRRLGEEAAAREGERRGHAGNPSRVAAMSDPRPPSDKPGGPDLSTEGPLSRDAAKAILDREGRIHRYAARG